MGGSPEGAKAVGGLGGGGMCCGVVNALVDLLAGGAAVRFELVAGEVYAYGWGGVGVLEVWGLIIAVEKRVGWLVRVEVLRAVLMVLWFGMGFAESIMGRFVIWLVGGLRYWERGDLGVVCRLILHGRYDPFSPFDDGFLHANWSVNAVEFVI